MRRQRLNRAPRPSDWRRGDLRPGVQGAACSVLACGLCREVSVELCWVGNDAEEVEPDQVAERFWDVAVVRCEQGAFARLLHLVKAVMTIADHSEPIRYGSL